MRSFPRYWSTGLIANVAILCDTWQLMQLYQILSLAHCSNLPGFKSWLPFLVDMDVSLDELHFPSRLPVVDWYLSKKSGSYWLVPPGCNNVLAPGSSNTSKFGVKPNPVRDQCSVTGPLENWQNSQNTKEFMGLIVLQYKVPRPTAGFIPRTMLTLQKQWIPLWNKYLQPNNQDG